MNLNVIVKLSLALNCLSVILRIFIDIFSFHLFCIIFQCLTAAKHSFVIANCAFVRKVDKELFEILDLTWLTKTRKLAGTNVDLHKKDNLYELNVEKKISYYCISFCVLYFFFGDDWKEISLAISTRRHVSDKRILSGNMSASCT